MSSTFTSGGSARRVGGFNENRDPEGIGFRDRTFTVKYGHSFDLLD